MNDISNVTIVTLVFVNNETAWLYEYRR